MNCNLARCVLLASLACVGAFVLLAGEAQACPSCKAALANDEAGRQLQNGYFWSILFMLSMPFVIFTSLSTYFWWQVRKARAAQATVLVAVCDAAALAARLTPDELTRLHPNGDLPQTQENEKSQEKDESLVETRLG